ncbi:acid phosphatase [Bermanella marisrubri]|uniref:5'-nucleotidase n=1 Tax=Bermanella marisrubri TaxID=207949 RepID=Q1N3U1_9GAMM|nr:5'/3'-nucleotidase SurE [Bermanella marisrubri]EAT12783.1 acid phosphatase stationary-phase survival protein [Oceanobacter sp. RED65] [Bermanella marisrubri]QIZ83109.1 acid phosphatase [Bermanella marisrubri]
MKLSRIIASAIIATGFSLPASALNIILTNDDSWATDNIQILFTELKAAGHDVLMATPCLGQSGKGGAMNVIKEVNVDRSIVDQGQVCVGDTDESVPYDDFVAGTPVMAVLYGIDVLAEETWGQAPDLVISGPNEGNNLGYITNNSGTLGAANIAIARGIPAIAISADDGDAEKAVLVASAVNQLIAELEANRGESEPLLPKFTGLNVNTPEDMANNLGFKFANVGWNASDIGLKFFTDLSKSRIAIHFVALSLLKDGHANNYEEATGIAKYLYKDKPGVSFVRDAELIDDNNENSEGVLVDQGYITISTIEANVQASRAKTALTAIKLHGLTQ